MVHITYKDASLVVYSSYIVGHLSDYIIARIIVDYAVRVVKVDNSWLTCTEEVASMHNSMINRQKNYFYF